MQLPEQQVSARRRRPARRPAGRGPARPRPDARIAFYDRLLPRLEAIAGVESVSFTTSVPPFGGGRRGIDIEDFR